MTRDTGIAARLRAAGLRVVEVDGWQTRGKTDLAAGGAVLHHTAGPPTGATPSLNTCINGRPDLAGPLCQVFQSRESTGDDIAYVVAAGKANHAGDGGWQGLTGNASVYGLEVEHDGVTPFPARRLTTASRIIAALFTGPVGMCCMHAEWTPRKVDVATGVDGDDFRREVSDARAGPPKPPPLAPEGEAMFTLFYVTQSGRYYTMTPWHIGALSVEDGYALDAASTGLAAVVVPTVAAWNEIARGAPAADD